MPIYAYKCDSCGFAKDVLQKLSDAPLSQCPSCDTASFRKQLTAAGFQLKGSGWYVTDFRDAKGPAAVPAEGKSSVADAPKTQDKADGKAPAKADGKTETRKADAPAGKVTAAAPTTGPTD